MLFRSDDGVAVGDVDAARDDVAQPSGADEGPDGRDTDQDSPEKLKF